MKRLLLILLFFSVVSQAQYVQITFVENYNVNFLGEPGGSGTSGSDTTDATINTIFDNHGIIDAYYGFGDGYPNIRCRIFTHYGGTNIGSFLSDLENYANVESAKICPDAESLADVMTIELVNSADGNPVGFDTNGNVVTTNAALNALFANYGVKSMTLFFSVWDDIFYIYFEGDIISLKNDLDNLDTVIENAYYGSVIVLLSTDGFTKPSVAVHPNPFKDHINIESSESISNYSLYDSSGKEIVNTNSKSILDTACINLASGMYILKLESDNGTIFSRKLHKK